MDAYDGALDALRRGDYTAARGLLRRAGANDDADDADPRAWLLLGQLASEGIGEPENPTLAAEHYTRGADLGDPTCAANLAAMYATGQGVPADAAVALHWYRRAAELGDTDALVAIGVLSARGEGVPPDPAEAERCWRRAADLGNAAAMVQLGEFFERGPGADPVEAAYWYLESAMRGETGAEPALARLRHRLKPLADAGVARAQALLAAILLEFAGEPAAAAELFASAAARGETLAQRGLGHMHLNGIGVPRDPARAAELFEAAAHAGDGPSALSLGRMYAWGDGVPRDPERAARFLGLAAERGLPGSYGILADQLAALGQGAQARHWYVRAGECGNAQAMYALAVSYREGTGGPVDPVQALRWFLAMLGTGNGDGIHEAHEMVPHMDVEQVREAARLAGQSGAGERLLELFQH